MRKSYLLVTAQYSLMDMMLWLQVMSTGTEADSRYRCIECGHHCNELYRNYCDGVVKLTQCVIILYLHIKVKGKVLPYLLPSVRPGADPSIQAVSLQVTFKSSPWR